MVKKKTKLQKAEASTARAQKRAAVAKAQLDATNKLIEKGWRPV